MTVFYIVRHGVTRSNLEGRHLGQREEDLTEEGLRQASSLAELLKNEPLDVIYTSPLRRARDTASEIAKYHLGKSPLSDPRLMELHMGIFEGRLPDDARSLFADFYTARENDKFGFQIPGGESYRMLIERVEPFVRDKKEEYLNGNVCVVGHQGFNRALLAILLRDVITEERMKTVVPYLEIPHEAYFRVDTSSQPPSALLISSALRLNLEERI